jgi:hypothetical protein
MVSGVASVLTFGAVKYKANSWQDLEDGPNRYFSAMNRHYIDSQEDYDSESKLHHGFHFLCNAVFLTWFWVVKGKRADVGDPI